MKSLLIVRHAKSSWKQPELDDRQRPLNKRGKRDAPLMGKRLAERGLRPQTILSSPAARALATARIIGAEIGYSESDIVVDERLYHSSASDLLNVIYGLENGLDQVMVVGHNPGLTELVNHLSSEYIDNVPTCGVVAFEFDVRGWEELAGPVKGRMEFDFPKQSI
jgi:phosphohistidine phosphatase